MKTLQSFLIINLLFFIISCSSYRYTPDITETDLKQHLTYLASDEVEGRYPGTEGDKKSSRYIEDYFKRIGLTAGIQDFPFLKAVKRGQNNALEINGHSFLSEEFTPFAFSKDTSVMASVVFAGYGITVKADTFEWDDYKNIDVKGKWVLAFRGIPSIPGLTDFLSLVSEDRDKAMLAADNGAAGLLLVSGYNFDASGQLVTVSSKQARVGIPVIHISRTIADSLLKMQQVHIADLESVVCQKKMSNSFSLDVALKATTEIENIMGSTGNRYAVIEGSDPVLKKEYIVIGAHYDHLGNGGQGSSSRKQDTVAVHNGADDNASGVSIMLELADKLRKDPLPGRSVILVAFGAEEMGLLGSKYFVGHMPVDISNVVAMVNLDMVGRLDSAKGLQIGGTGTSLEADSLIMMANASYGLNIKKSREGSGPSDHSSFYGKNIPVFFITTGAHSDYHTPEDDISRINMQGMKTISDFTSNLVAAIADIPLKPTFQKAGPKEAASGPGYRFKVTLGFMPDFSDTDTEGVRVDFVSKGKAAERGGIKNGDVITAIDGRVIKNIYDYMYRLGKLQKNQIISVEILRNGIKEVLVIQL